jgi:spore coat protein H
VESGEDTAFVDVKLCQARGQDVDVSLHDWMVCHRVKRSHQTLPLTFLYATLTTHDCNVCVNVVRLNMSLERVNLMSHRFPPKARRAGALTMLTLGAWIIGEPLLEAQRAATRPAGWDQASHDERARPDYARLFSTDVVHEIRIVIPRDRYDAMQADLQTLAPAFPGRPGGPGGGTGAPFPRGADGPSLAGAVGRGGGRGGRGMPGLTVRDPIYVPVTVHFNQRTWTHVAMRYKGNSSLMSAVGTGTSKIPFRLDFDRYENDHPEIRNQRFYGFGELTFASNTGDDSQVREAFATEVLRDRGVPAARAAFYRVMVDTGAGPEYWGLYTMIEDPSDGAMLDSQFGNSAGNLYKPDGPGATWAAFDRESFPKKSNEDAADFGDIEGAIRALHASRTDARAWRTGLESRFDADLFLRWLAVNTAIQNWDAYGAMPHNYYLYADPAQNNRLRWIPWDHNFSLGARPVVPGGRGFMRGAPPPAGVAGPPGDGGPGPFPPPGRGGFPAMFGAGGTDVLHAQVGSEWPLIQKLLSDDVYAARYRGHLQNALGGLFAPPAAARRLRQLHALVTPAVLAERPASSTVSSPEAFKRALDGPDGLLEVIEGRHRAIRTALAGGDTR